MTVPSEHCEVKLHGFRRTQDGVVVSFVVNPVEVPTSLALDPLGTRYMIALARIGDDEQAVPATTSAKPMASPKESAPQRGDTLRSERAKENYRQGTPGEQARVRAVLLCNDRQFQQWVSQKAGWECSAEDCAEWLKIQCGIGSRREIATDGLALGRFLAVETDYRQATGQMATPR